LLDFSNVLLIVFLVHLFILTLLWLAHETNDDVEYADKEDDDAARFVAFEGGVEGEEANEHDVDALADAPVQELNVEQYFSHIGLGYDEQQREADEVEGEHVEEEVGGLVEVEESADDVDEHEQGAGVVHIFYYGDHDSFVWFLH
jgi:hypothetical protein